jgi:hypothetical protein
MFVLTLPLSQGQGALAMLAFLGGFSSATSMVIVEAIALATMVSNHIVMPGWLRLRPRRAMSGDLRGLVLNARRVSVAAVLALGYGYYRMSGGSGGAGHHRADLLRGGGAIPAGHAGGHLLARRDAGRGGGGAGHRLCRSGPIRCSCRPSARARCCRARC